MKYLNRDKAPFSTTFWRDIDEEAVRTASALLTGRRFLDFDGPYGPGLTNLEIGSDNVCDADNADGATAVGSRAISVPMLRKLFKLSIRRLAGHADMAQPLMLNPVGEAAEAIARREEKLIYHGEKTFGLPGLLTCEASSHIDCPSWNDLEHALQSVLRGVTQLDTHQFPGPYALAMAPHLYNGLYRRYNGSDMLQVEHLGRLCSGGIFKAPIDGAVLVDARVGRLVVGQDLMAGYVSQDGVHCEMFLTESIALVIQEPKAICVLKVASAGSVP